MLSALVHMTFVSVKCEHFNMINISKIHTRCILKIPIHNAIKKIYYAVFKYIYTTHVINSYSSHLKQYACVYTTWYMYEINSPTLSYPLTNMQSFLCSNHSSSISLVYFKEFTKPALDLFVFFSLYQSHISHV